MTVVPRIYLTVSASVSETPEGGCVEAHVLLKRKKNRSVLSIKIFSFKPLYPLTCHAFVPVLVT